MIGREWAWADSPLSWADGLFFPESTRSLASPSLPEQSVTLVFDAEYIQYECYPLQMPSWPEGREWLPAGGEGKNPAAPRT